MEKVTWRTLSWQLKVAFIGGWISITIFGLFFLVGFLEGLLGL